MHSPADPTGPSRLTQTAVTCRTAATVALDVGRASSYRGGGRECRRRYEVLPPPSLRRGITEAVSDA